jgi:hypothetical protein
MEALILQNNPNQFSQKVSTHVNDFLDALASLYNACFQDIICGRVENSLVIPCTQAALHVGIFMHMGFFVLQWAHHFHAVFRGKHGALSIITRDGYKGIECQVVDWIQLTQDRFSDRFCVHDIKFF